MGVIVKIKRNSSVDDTRKALEVLAKKPHKKKNL